jgi:type II restriction/modification system DNA methylase subunit YeeA
MILKELKPLMALNKAFLKLKPTRIEIDNFKTHLMALLDSMNDTESEEFHKNLVIDFLKKTYYDPAHFVNTKGKNDLVIHNNNTAQSSVGVIIEAKKPTNKAEMISTQNLNAKAFHELILYYLRERITHKNLEIKHLIITNNNEWFIFDAIIFDRLFAQNSKFVKQFNDFESGILADTKTDFFYKEIAKPFIENITEEIEFTYFNLQDYQTPLRNADKEDDNLLIALFKILSPEHLLKLPFANDSNTLDRKFYAELLHILGLTEVKEAGKKLIQRNKEGERFSGSILEEAIAQIDSLYKLSRLPKPNQYGATKEERLFEVALELTITWINRVLFLKLLEAQLIGYHQGDMAYAFLHKGKIKGYHELNNLFFQVLARQPEDRHEDVRKIFEKVPYLNSSLFELTDLEQVTLSIGNLTSSKTIPIFSATVLKDYNGDKKTGELNTLEYLFEFLHSYDFGSEGIATIQEENKPLINAAVLGLIFEKINGYKDGSFFTPGFITMYMCRETIRKAVVQKFNEVKKWNCTTIKELYEKIEDRKEANQIINSIKICDPAVGSGHFLVSALNEMIAVKNDLKLLFDRNGDRLKEYDIVVVNDELSIIDDNGKLFEYKPKGKESQRVQEALFHEKQTIIENCLFGVDINPNSVKICRLRLWIELLKSAYYKSPLSVSPLTPEGGTTPISSNSTFGSGRVTPPSGAGGLETLPNIDINIKCGNSLVSRFAIGSDLTQALKRSKWNIDSYKNAVSTYRNSTDKEQKSELERLIADIKSDFRSEISKNDPKLVKKRKLEGELFNLMNQTSVFELSEKEKKEQSKKADLITKEIVNLEVEIEKQQSNKIFENAFEWRFEFPEVLNDEGEFMGFDVVIGNPPYIQLQSMKEISEQLRQFEYQTYEKSGDMYSLFYEKGNAILKNQGYLAYITSNKWMRAAYGKTTRNYLLENTQPELLVDLGGGVFDEATVDANILIFKKQSYQTPFAALDISKEKYTGNLHQFNDKKITINVLKDESWIIANTFQKSLKAKIERKGKLLKDWDTNIYRGILTGYNDAFIIDGKKKDELIAQDPKNAEIIKPILRGRDIQRYKAEFADLWLLNTHNGELVTIKNQKHIDFNKKRIFRNETWEKVSNLEITPHKNQYRINRVDVNNYPTIYKHLRQFEKQLIERQDKGEHWTNLRNCTYMKEFEKEKIVYNDICQKLTFSLVPQDILFNNTAYFLNVNSKYLLAVLNSNLIDWYYRTLSVQLGEKAVRMFTIYVENIPIPQLSKVEQKPFISLVQKILTKKEKGEDTTALETEIDKLVYQLYDLTEEEIRVIEGVV